jgi:hypothetical protein
MSRIGAGSPVAVLLSVVALLLLSGHACSADDMWMSSGLDWSFLTFQLTIAIGVIVAYVLLTVVLEAWVLSWVLRCGFWAGLAYSMLANFASGGVGAVWWLLGGQVGWKTAVIQHHWALAAAHVVRSFLVTLAIESLVLIGVLRREPDTKRVLKAVALANAVSYVLVFMLLITATAMWPKEPTATSRRGAPDEGAAATNEALGVRPAATDALVAGPAPGVLLAANVPHSISVHDAARRGDAADVMRYVRLGANVNARDAQGLTPLHWAAAAGNATVAQALIEAGADVNATSPDGVTPLHVAAHMGRREVMSLLLAHGADPTARDRRGRTASDWATQGASRAR